jgi:hypothetical protein
MFFDFGYIPNPLILIFNLALNGPSQASGVLPVFLGYFTCGRMSLAQILKPSKLTSRVSEWNSESGEIVRRINA